MNSRYNIIILLCGLFLVTSCNKYLDVQPEASYTELQVYGNESALQQALNGLYIGMASNYLYGANMSTTIIEMLAQRVKSVYDLAGRRNLDVINNYQYGSETSKAIFDTLWKQGYSTILATNVFISKIDNSIKSKVVSEAHGNELKGEALAIRAMIHFDLLRLFGPVYSLSSTSPAIPYYTLADAKLQPLLSPSQVMDKVMADFTEAAGLLSQDPVITNGVAYNTDFYSGLRNQRINYYAVKGLMARAYLWQGKKDLAHNTALAVITEGEKWFPWTEYAAATDQTNPDRIFSTEVLFGLYNPSLYTNYNLYFSPAMYDGAIMVPDSARLKEVYESNLNDYRYSISWKKQGKDYPTFFKYADVPSTTRPWRFVQPLLRKSEMYYILSETDTDPVKSLDYLNSARRKRGLVPLTSSASVPAEIGKEYQKEFWGEGQLFFYYKRLNVSSIPGADLPYSWYTVSPEYSIPLPLSETATR